MKNMMEIAGVKVVALIAKCGSPLYVYDEAQIEAQIEAYQNHFVSPMFETEVIYASKAFTCQALLDKLIQYDLSLDVVSGGELYVASKGKFNPQRIYFHGNNKTKEELRQALTYQVKTIVVDNVYEVDELINMSNELKTKVHVLIRLNPKVEAHTHEYIMTANADSKFGISVDLKDDIYGMITQINNSEYVCFDGFHSHIGSQIFERQGFVEAIHKMCQFINHTNIALDMKVKVLNIGGGFGVTYTSEDKPTPTPLMCKTLIEAIQNNVEKYDLQLEKVCMEPGRSIVAEAGYTLYEVGFIKQTKNKQFAFINGGMADNIRPALYGAKYHCEIANKMNETKTQVYDIAGKCCESGDIIIHEAHLPKVESSDILAVYSTGAYGSSMASNYNRINRLGVVFVKDGNARMVVKPETYEQQIQNDCDEEITL